ncbi:MAG: hypothetical protein RMJ82_00925 [Gemmatales bacterium]|nr:hypothetical protein [Gemmatales bacterium]
MLVPEAGAQVRIEQVRVGFPDQKTRISYGRFGHWLPVYVVVTHDSQEDFTGSVAVSMPDADGILQESRAEETLQLSSVTRRQGVWAYVMCGHGKLRVQVRDQQERPVASFTFPDDLGQARFWQLVPPAVQQILTLGGPAGLEDVLTFRETGPDPGYRVCQLDDPQYLPERWFGYDGVQVIVWATGGQEGEKWLDALQARPALARALRQWVQQGGHLVLCAAERADWLTQRERFPLMDLLPGDGHSGRPAYAELLVGVREVTASRHREPTALPALRAPWAEFRKKPTATQRAFAADPLKPAVLVWPYGLGQVTLVAFDTNVGAFTQWEGRTAFWEWLLETETLPARQAFRTTLTVLREPEPLTELIHQLEQFQTEEIPFALVAGLMFVYLVLAGPLDYVLTVRWLRRPAWAWLTFPLAVAGVTVLAWYSAWVVHGHQLAVHELVLYDLELQPHPRGDTPLVRGSGSAWLVLKSPQLAAYSLTLAGSPRDTARAPLRPGANFMGDVREAVLGWAVRPDDDALQRGQRENLVQSAVEVEPGNGRLARVPMQAWSVKTLFARWLLDWKTPPTLCEARLRAPDLNTVRGELTWHAPWPLLSSELTFGSRVWFLGDLHPQQKIAVRRNDVALLDRHRFQNVRETSGDSELLGHSGEEVSRQRLIETLRQMTFQRLFIAGRRQAPQPYLPHLDQSRRLRYGQAVLTGYLPMTEIRLDQLDQHASLSPTLTHLEPNLPGILKRMVFVRMYIPMSERD